jgi:hypothetical protein
VAESTRLLSEYLGEPGSRVRIPLSPVFAQKSIAERNLSYDWHASYLRKMMRRLSRRSFVYPPCNTFQSEDGLAAYRILRRGGRVVECSGLENRHLGRPGSGVRISPSPYCTLTSFHPFSSYSDLKRSIDKYTVKFLP